MRAKPILALALSLVVLIASLVLLAQDTKLVEAAKKEGGQVVVYGSIENDTMELISAAFKKKTGLNVEFWRAASTKVMDRVLGESRTGKPLYDVVLTITPPMEFMYKEGALGKYDSMAAKRISQGSHPSKPRSTCKDSVVTSYFCFEGKTRIT